MGSGRSGLRGGGGISLRVVDLASLPVLAYQRRIAYSPAVGEAPIPLLLLALGVLATGVGTLLVRWSGADTRAGRRLAGARPVSLADLAQAAAAGELPPTAVRVAGRVRCATPIPTADGERLALLHRDVEVELADGTWKTIERFRDARPIDLWQRTVSVPLDLARLAEPLVTIPHLWEGSPDELDSTHRPAVDRVADEQGPLRRARATTRRVMLVDELTVLAVPRRGDDGALRLDPPPGGYLASTVDLDVAMRLLAGPHRRRMLTGFGLVAIGAVAGLIGAVAVVVQLLA
jgi:hypothetical protein